ncbi:signal peptide peptidase SppA [Chitinophaga pendula]|uniref:signal peptide peptidase SppA n=1 Tax=Chitinophaga TaxID=79328 RepID=UPI000BAED5C3|nr:MULTISPECIES: signal peptide peptidase SppA [Chitinophaga]ASZ12077.1 signal peptide peptidase SppA [Chitinophaga sp. MD30]UCJ04885.1 signal peptide peptidase SppA [Chitinophaga pendula]
MRSFFKIFFASLLAFIVFMVIGVLVIGGIIAGMVGKALAPETVTVSPNSVLVIETGQYYNEQATQDPVAALTKRGPVSTPGLHDVVELIRQAAKDDNIKGIYIKGSDNPNGFATTEEVRNALINFKRSGKFIYGYAEYMSQKGYYLASAADKIYLHPKGGLDFNGFAMNMMYLKGALEKLEIEPQVIFDGKFKSATEPLREKQMTDANRVQTTQFLSELYGIFLEQIGRNRKIDTASLHRYANEGLIQQPEDALKYKLVDGLKYDDQVMDELRTRLGLKKEDNINFITMGQYGSAESPYKEVDGNNKIAVVYAAGNIVGGDSEADNVISGEAFLKHIRKVRLDKSVKAIVFRVNSGGGSALASETIWRELELAKKDKPVVVSMGDYAASGGYYISCMADSVFAQPNTLTGSIGVFAVLPNFQGFLNNKLGITFDGVKTAQYADMGNVTRPLTPAERQMIQASIDSTYATFKSRVVAGRKLSPDVVDSIAQGRVWSGVQAKRLGLVDRIGGLDDAITSAAKLAGIKDYRLRQYPEAQNPINKLMKTVSGDASTSLIKRELGQNFTIYQQLKRLREMTGSVQAALPFDMQIR